MTKNKTQQQKMNNLENKTTDMKLVASLENTVETTLYLNNLYADSMEYHYLLPIAS